MKKTVLEQILSPSEEYSPIPFWFFNDEPDRDKIRMQLEDYVAKGVNGLVLHPRIGIPESLQYLSKEYFLAALMAHSLASAPELEKNTLDIPVFSHKRAASLAMGSV